MLLEEIMNSSNLHQAYDQGVGNKCAPGTDKVGHVEFKEQIASEWRHIKLQLEQREYPPSFIKRVKIPKPNGGERLLGIPTYMDRLIQ